MDKTILKLPVTGILLIAVMLTGACTTSTKYELTTAVEPAGSGTVSPGGFYDSGSKIRVTAAPNQGYTFDGWSGDASGTDAVQTVTMDANKSLTARFERTGAVTVPESVNATQPGSHAVLVQVTPFNAGTVTPSSAMYEEGTQVTLTATPAEGYRFVWWEGDASGSSNTVTITVDGEKNILARFVEFSEQSGVKQYALITSVYPEGAGLVTPSDGLYNIHAPLTLTAMASEGYAFHHWEGSISGTSDTIDFYINEDMDVLAYFVEKPPLTLTSSAFESEGIIPDLYSCKGADISPPLSWRGVPYGTVSFVLIVDDPDAPQGVFTHWIIYNIPGYVQSLAENIPHQAELSDGSLQGYNNFGELHYDGPCPPKGQKHEYRFRLYALDSTIELTPYQSSRYSVLELMKGHILDETRLSGYFQN